MGRYSGTQAMDAVPVDPVAEGAAPGGETGLEEPMWQSGLGGGPESYPERPDEPDCPYYLRTGFCGFGNRCRFNHPRERSMAVGALRAGGSCADRRPPRRAEAPIQPRPRHPPQAGLEERVDRLADEVHHLQLQQEQQFAYQQQWWTLWADQMHIPMNDRPRYPPDEPAEPPPTDMGDE